MAMKNKEEILDGRAIIFQNAHEIWQFRSWVSREKSYLRESLRTKNKSEAIELGVDRWIEIQGIVKSGERLFGKPIEEAIQPFLDFKKSQIGIGDEYTIVEGRYKTINTHLRHFVRYIGPKTKITDLKPNFLNSYVVKAPVPGPPTNYPLWRKSQGIGPTTIHDEMSTIGMCFKYLFEEGVTNIRAIKYPQKTKNMAEVDGEKIRRQTFTDQEYKHFTNALSKTYVAPVAVKNNVTEKEWFNRQLARHYFLFAANSGMRSGELRKLKWEDVGIDTVGGGNTPEVKLVKVRVPAMNSKVRKSRTFFCVGAIYLERWGKEFATHRTGYIFSKDGTTEMPNWFFLNHFEAVLKLSKIEPHRQKQLVPYSLRHFCVTNRVMAGCSLFDVAQMLGTSTTQIEKTYFHLNDAMRKRTATARYEVLDGIAVPLVNVLDESL